MWECKSFLRIFRIISVLKMLKAEKSFDKENLGEHTNTLNIWVLKVFYLPEHQNNYKLI